LRERRSLNIVSIEANRNRIVTGSRERIVASVTSVSEILSINELSRNLAVGSSDDNFELLTADGLEVVRLGLGSDGEREFLEECVLEGSTLFDHHSVRALGDGVVLQIDVDSVFAALDWVVGNIVGTIVVIDDLCGHIASWSLHLNFERITTFTHVVTESVSRFDVEDGWLGIVDVLETGSPNE